MAFSTYDFESVPFKIEDNHLNQLIIYTTSGKSSGTGVYEQVYDTTTKTLQARVFPYYEVSNNSKGIIGVIGWS